MWLLLSNDVDSYEIEALTQHNATQHLIHLVRFLDMGGLWGFPAAMHNVNLTADEVVRLH